MPKSCAQVIYVGVPRDWGTPSYATVLDAVDAICEAASRIGATPRRVPISGRLGHISHSLGGSRLRLRPSSVVVLPLMGPKFHLLRHASNYARPLVIAWDIWEPELDKWSNELAINNVAGVICTSTMACDGLKNKLPLRVTSMPEAINLNRYRSGGLLADRDVDVLQIGRKHERWHSAITADSDPQLSYDYESKPGALRFERGSDLAGALANARVAVCFSQNQTHPERAGSFETLTQRYLEAMVAGCIVLGNAPAELVKLCGYDPVVAVDWADPQGQLRDVIRDVRSYQKLVERNQITALRVGGWLSRVGLLEKELSFALNGAYRHDHLGVGS